MESTDYYGVLRLFEYQRTMIKPHLTTNELRVLADLVDGELDEEIAKKLGVDNTSLEELIKSILLKLNAQNLVQVGAIAVSIGLVYPSIHLADEKFFAQAETVTQIDLSSLTKREKDILMFHAQDGVAGWTNHKLATHLGISHHTIRQHLRQIYKKLAIAQSRSELVRIATVISLSPYAIKSYNNVESPSFGEKSLEKQMMPPELKYPFLSKLTPREREIFDLIGDDKFFTATNQHIANELCIGASTVETHLRNIYWKLQIYRSNPRLVLFKLSLEVKAYIAQFNEQHKGQ